MLKHDRTRPRKKSWTMRYLRWLQEQQFDHPAHQIALQETVEVRRQGVGRPARALHVHPAASLIRNEPD